MKITLIAMALWDGTAAAAPVPCMNYDPSHPHASRAPTWAVNVAKRQHDTDMADPYDPGWQHGWCDKEKAYSFVLLAN